MFVTNGNWSSGTAFGRVEKFHFPLSMLRKKTKTLSVVKSKNFKN